MIDYTPFWDTLGYSEKFTGKLVYFDKQTSYVPQHTTPLKAQSGHFHENDQ